MKITSDVNLLNRRVPDINPGKNSVILPQPDNRTSDSQIQNQVTRGIQRDRAQLDALIIAQVSRDLIQKAITISARLQAAASEAFTTGRIDAVEVKNQVSFISGDIADYGGMVSKPQLRTQGEAGVVAAEQFNRMREYGENLLNRERVDPQVFAAISENLNEVSDQMSRSIDAFYSDFRTAEIRPDGGAETRAVGNMSREILNNPSGALNAQGNLSPEIAGNLSMA
jgi:hypothetical protein